MRQFFRSFIALLLIILILTGTINTYAKDNSNGKNVVLSEKYNSKKVDRIKNSINQKNNYRFLINTNDSIEELTSYFESIDKKIKIKSYSNGNYMIKLPKNTNLINVGNIDSGLLPTVIGKYNIVQPEIVEGFGYLDSEETSKLWGNNLVGANTFQEDLQTKEKVKVAILDTGIDYNNTDLDNNYNSELSFNFIDESSDSIDDNGHGTQVAGIIGSEVNGMGRYGVNSNSDLVSLKVLDTNGIGTSYDILEAIDYAKQNGIKVINMSFGGIGDPATSSVCSVITDAKSNGIFVVVSAGNNNTDISNTIPAGCSDSIVVGAIKEDNTKADFSNYGDSVVYAPGVNIYTTGLNNSYGTISGTSFSSAFVSGLVSKELAYNSNLTYDEVVNNVKNNYNLVHVLSENQVSETINQTITGTGWLNTDDLYSRFSDFEYLFNTDDNIYFTDKLNSEVVYKISNDNSIFGFGVNYGNSIFFNNELYSSDYFNSGEYISFSQFVNERNQYYEFIGYENNNLDETKFSIQSLGLGKYNINHKFNNISGIKLNNISSKVADIIPNTNNLIYTRLSGNNFNLYKKSLSSYGDGTQLTTDNVMYWVNSIKLSQNGDYLLYTNGTNGNKLYKKYISNSGNGSQIVSVEGDSIDISNDENFMIYRNGSDGYKLYKKNSNDTLNGEAITSVFSLFPIITKDQNYVIYVNVNDGYKLYKKAIGTSGNGTVFTTASVDSPKLSKDGNFIVYRNKSDNYKLYKKGISQSGNGYAITSYFTYLFDISEDGNYITYKSTADNGNLYKKLIGDSGLGTKLADIKIESIRISDYSNEVAYSNGNDYGKLYKVNLLNPKGYTLDDGLFNSPEILPGKNLTNLKIDINSTVPTGTNYNFYLANQKTEENLFEANESGIDMMMNDIYLFGDNYVNGTRQEILSKVNVGDTIYLDKNGNIGEFEVEYKDDWMIRVVYNGQDLWEYAGARVYIGGSNFVKIDNSKLDGNTNLDLNSIFGFTTDKLYYKIELIGDESDTTKTPVINSVEFKDGSIPSEPINLKQYVKSPGLYKEEFGSGTTIGTKVGKFQSGTGIILSANVNNDITNPIKLEVEIYNVGNLITPKYIGYSENTISVGNSGNLEVIIPYSILGEGNYYWKARTIDNNNGYKSNGKDFETNTPWDSDFTLYEGFEPYPYGYDFFNRSPEPGFLTGSVSYSISPIFGLVPIGSQDGGKWKIFEKAFDTSVFESDIEKWSAFDSVGLNNPKVFQDGNCYGMAVSSAMQYSHPDFVQSHFSDFRTKVGNGTVWDNIDSPSITSTGAWNIYNETLETILAFQLSQYSEVAQDATLTGTSSLDLILTTLKNNSDKTYTLSLKGKDSDGGPFGHRVVPYKVEGNKIYIWDNNFEYPYRDYGVIFPKYANKQYIEIYTDADGKTKWKTSNNYGINEYEKLTLVDMDILYNDGNKSIPNGFGDTDSLYTLSGSSDFYVVDDLGRVSGFLSGSIVEEIPGVNIIIPENYAIGIETEENTWKQIYLPQKQDLTVKVSADLEESYDLIVAGGDYYTKISGVETSSGQVDSFVPTRENLQIDFDDNKLGDYNLMMNNFHDSGTGTIYMENVESKIEPQQYIVSWTGVIDNSIDSVIYELDTDNDGTFDESINLPPVYQDNIAPTTSYDISGELNSNTSNTYIETATIDLNAIDNDGGTGVDKIYYVIGTDTGSLVYVEYTEPVIVNGVGDYTLNYYSNDLFGNIEEVKTVSFSLTERPETYAGNISGYVYDDENNNGLENEGEKRMAGWKVCIDLNNNNDCEEQNEPFNVTNNDGYYEFDSLETGNYKILEIPHQNWIVTNPTEGSYNINLQNGQKVEQKNFGNFKVKQGKK